MYNYNFELCLAQGLKSSGGGGKSRIFEEGVKKVQRAKRAENFYPPPHFFPSAQGYN